MVMIIVIQNLAKQKFILKVVLWLYECCDCYSVERTYIIVHR